jgi:hypothetical protein
MILHVTMLKNNEIMFTTMEYGDQDYDCSKCNKLYVTSRFS